ncbi:jg13330, partial [Pararge aegeria aegeria]
MLAAVQANPTPCFSFKCRRNGGGFGGLLGGG